MASRSAIEIYSLVFRNANPRFIYDIDTPHQCKPDDLFRERLGNNRRMDIRVFEAPTAMEGPEASTRGQRPRRSIVPHLEEEDA